MAHPGTWRARAVLAPALAVLMAFPLSLTIGDLDLANAMVQAVAVLSVLLVLPAQFLLDARTRRPGAGIRFAVLGLACASVFAFGWAAVRRGFSPAALLSLLNWIALGGLIVTGQLLFADLRRLTWAMTAWAVIQSIVALGAAVYLLGEFGGELFVATSRAPFQAAVHEVLTAWPNSAGMAFAVSGCIAFGQLRAGAGGKWWIIFPLLALGVLVTFSRNAWLSLIVGVTAMTLSGTRLIRSLPFALLVVVAIVGMGSQIPAVRYQVEVTVTPGSSEQMSIIQRLAFAAEAVRIWRESPLVGIGFGRFEDYASLDRLSTASIVRADYVPGSVHNEYLSTLLKGGVITLVPFLGVLILLLGIMRRAARSTDELRRWGIAGTGMLATLTIGGMGGETFRQVPISAPLWLLAGGLSILLRRPPGSATPPSR
jgi:O-antigen ligase